MDEQANSRCALNERNGNDILLAVYAFNKTENRSGNWHCIYGVEGTPTRLIVTELATHVFAK